MTVRRGRLPSGSWIDVGVRYRTRGGWVVQVVEIRDTGLPVRDFKGRQVGTAVLIVVEDVDGSKYAVHDDGSYRTAAKSDSDLIRAAFISKRGASNGEVRSDVPL